MKMAKIKTADLIGANLDFAVALAIGLRIEYRRSSLAPGLHPMVIDSVNCGRGPYHYSTDWAHGGPIIEREGIMLVPHLNKSSEDACWRAIHGGLECRGETPLVAAMRLLVSVKMGSEVDDIDKERQ